MLIGSHGFRVALWARVQTQPGCNQVPSEYRLNCCSCFCQSPAKLQTSTLPAAQPWHACAEGTEISQRLCLGCSPLFASTTTRSSTSSAGVAALPMALVGNAPGAEKPAELDIDFDWRKHLPANEETSLPRISLHGAPQTVSDCSFKKISKFYHRLTAAFCAPR